MRIRYFFTNKRDNSLNNFIWQDAPRPLCIQDLRKKMTSLGIVDKNSHLRFLDKIKGEKIWLDIINDDVECPSNSEGVVDVKIVQQYYTGSQAFMDDLFNGFPGSAYKETVFEFRQKVLKTIFQTPKDREKTPPEEIWENNKNSGYAKFEDNDEFENKDKDEFNGIV